MIREYLLDSLTDAFGEPRSGPNHEWWFARRGVLNAVHVCLNQKMPSPADEAHLMIFDPANSTGKTIIELHPRSEREADEAVAMLKHIVHGGDAFDQ